MTTNLVELYSMDENSRIDFVKGLSDSDLISLMQDINVCIQISEEIFPMYEDLYNQENKSVGLIAGLWRKINSKARIAAEEKYNNLKAKIESALENSKSMSLYPLFDKAMDETISKYPNLTKEYTSVRKASIFMVGFKLAEEITKICLDEVERRGVQ